MKVIINIGPHKTGTTSLQRALAEMEKSRALCTSYYSTKPDENHSVMVGQAFSGEYPDYYRSGTNWGRIPSHRTAEQRNEARKYFISEIRRASKKKKDLILIGECFSLLHPKEVATLKSVLDSEGYNDSKVVAYVRPAEEWANSYSNQLLKGWEAITISQILDCPPVPRYRTFIQKYFDIFGSVNVRQFDKANFPEGSLWLDFCSVCGLLDVPKIEKYEKFLGESLNLEATRCWVYLRKSGVSIFKTRKIMQHFHSSGVVPNFSLTRNALDHVCRESEQD
ncbi:hypothetical protein Thiowin_04093 [Thiorhodovibrio winogradskyi]|uniref:Uncharacterized protein n=1 Tax=Thiorhodovibrio winogradskyi TaxID=77007 RepID=A0ABZ0SFW3_9GAMM|nr:sulfotransferase [Thiorhodovibrio winogradskyi]